MALTSGSRPGSGPEVLDGGTELARRAVGYLRECYRADVRATGYGHLFARGVRHLVLFPREVVFCDVGDRQPLPLDLGDALAADAAASARERELVYFAGAVVGRVEVAGRRHRICAPLLVAPATVEESIDGFRLLVDREAVTVNERALRPAFDSDGSSEDATAALSSELPPLPWSAGGRFALAEAWSRHCPEVNGRALERLGEPLPDVAALKKVVRTSLRGSRGRVLAVAGAALVPRPRGTRGVLHELELLEERAPATVVRTLLSAAPVSPGLGKAPPPRTPAVLSRAQETARTAAATRPVTVLVGPPGTGKTFTIAAIALDRAARGESVLVASGRPEAVRVVEEKIAELSGVPDLVLRVNDRTGADPTGGAGEGGDRIDRRLASVLAGDLGHLRARDFVTADLDARLAEIESRISKIEKEVVRRSKWEGRTPPPGPAWANPLESLGAAWRRWQLARLPAHWQRVAELEDLVVERSVVLRRLLRSQLRDRLEDALLQHRPQLVDLAKAQRARSSGRQAGYFSRVRMPVVFPLFPIWTTTFGEAHRALPFRDESFDLVVVDEATQCDLATALPTLQRGRRVLITGDPRQLRHVSFLARERQRVFAEGADLPEELREHLDYRSRSLLDAALDVAAGDAVATLDEHFRSHPSLIEFPNREIYGGRLRVMTARPGPRESRLELVRVDGRRGADGVNHAEVDAVLREIRRWTGGDGDARGGEARDPGEVRETLPPPSLGVLAVFRDQADALREALVSRLGADGVRRHRLLVGTPYAFQGDERDVVILSLGLDASAPAAAWRHLLRPDVFTVAVTRARHRQVVVHSFAADRAPGILGRYLASTGAAATSPPPRSSRWADEVVARLQERGHEASPGSETAGTPLDLVVHLPGGPVAVDLIGSDDPAGEPVDLERTRVLLRAGLPMFPLPFSAWTSDPDLCLDALLAWSPAVRSPHAGP